MSCFALTQTGTLDTTGAKLRIVRGNEEASAQVLAALLLWKGEYWLNPEAGTDWMQIFSDTLAIEAIVSQIEARVLSKPLVAAVVLSRPEIDQATQTLKIKIRATSSTGAVILSNGVFDFATNRWDFALSR